MNKIKDLPPPLPWERRPTEGDATDREPLTCHWCGAQDMHSAVLTEWDERRRILAHQAQCDSRTDAEITPEEKQAFCGFHSIRLLRLIRIRESALNSTIRLARQVPFWRFLRRRDLQYQISAARWEIGEIRVEAERLGLPDDWESQAMIRSMGLDPGIFRVTAMHRR